MVSEPILGRGVAEVTPEALTTALDVVHASGVLKDSADPVQYDAIVDMSFLDAASAAGE